MYWKIGQKIVEEEQGGEQRAEYGTNLIRELAAALEPKYGASFSKRNLDWFRQFYWTFPNVNALRSQFSWTHYRKLIQIENKEKKRFYIGEAAKSNWTARQLERQIDSLLYERFLMSKDIGSVLAIARKEQLPQSPQDIIKDPMMLGFLGLQDNATYREQDLESALIMHLQEFMLELGNGFAFMERQKRIHLDGDDFFVDLVFYNRLLQCFVLIELKTEKLKHEHLGQLQMYVNYYDRYEKQSFENPTIGILLCTDKNDAVVKISLPEENKTIVASKYQLYLPSEQMLLDEVKREIKQLEGEQEEKDG